MTGRARWIGEGWLAGEGQKIKRAKTSQPEGVGCCYNGCMADLSPELKESSQTSSMKAKLRWFSIGPVLGLVLALLAVFALTTSYQAEHDGRVFTGVQVANVDLSGLTPTEAEAALLAAWASAPPTTVTRCGWR